MARGKARGFSVQTSRGHREGRGQEHRVRKARALAKGLPTEQNRAFVRRQSIRSDIDFDELLELFISKTQAERDRLIERQQYYQRRYRAKVHRRAKDIAPDFRSFSDEDRPFIFYH